MIPNCRDKKRPGSQEFEFETIGVLQSCFKEKFGIPRQSGLIKHAGGVLKLHDDVNLKIAIRSLEGFSHLWLIFVFHRHGSRNWKPSIRPPRLGGAKKVGVLASRSPHRPNPIGISAVKLEKIDYEANGGPEIHLSGVDILDQTPILDIKPYIPYADSIPTALSGWADEPIARVAVEFSEAANFVLRERASQYPQLRALISEMLGLDPRPASQKRRMPLNSASALGTQHGFNLLEFDVKWQMDEDKFLVLEIATRTD